MGPGFLSRFSQHAQVGSRAGPTMNTPLEFFATYEAVAELEAALVAYQAAGGDAQQAVALVAVAWQMRQRDTKRSLALADEAERRIVGDGLSPAERKRISARLMLIRGEAKWLFGELDAGKSLAEGALHAFVDLGDALGRADAHWLRAWIALDQGDGAHRDAELEAMVCAAADSDPVRHTVAQATQACFAAFRDVAAAQRNWGTHFSSDTYDLHPVAACQVDCFWALVAVLSGDSVKAIQHQNRAYTLAVACGEIRRAVVTAVNIGNNFGNINDHHAALEWMQRGLDLARPRGWPSTMGATLLQTAETLRLLKRVDAAHDMLREALAMMAPIAASRTYAIALRNLGDVELDQRHYASALKTLKLAEQRAVALAQGDLIYEVRHGQARALLELGQPEAALQMAGTVLADANSYARRQIDALRVLADIHARHPLPPPTDMSAASAPLHYLHLALELAATIENFTVPGELLEAVAQAHANVGEHAKAFELAKQAIVARDKTHSQEASNHVSAMQVKHETENARAEGEHNRQLALAHAERAKTLEQSNATLEELGAVGRDITGNLEASAIFAALDKHVHGLLDATTFWIYRMEADGQSLKMVFGVEAGHTVPSHSIRMDGPQSRAARCARERQEVIADIAPGHGNIVPGTLETLSLMFAPLLVGERLLGVMTIQSSKPKAYGERERMIFRNLCAYGAIALANAETQAQVVQAGKMASLGQLVANVAHEINTPIGAIKSSGNNMLDALGQAMQSLPKVLLLLDSVDQGLFLRLIAAATPTLRTTREVRSLKREASQVLEDAGVAHAESRSAVLVQLNAHENIAHYLPLLRHAESDFILATAYSVASVVASAHNINTAVDRVAKIVFSLKSFSRVDSSAVMVEVNLAEGLETVLTLYHNQIKQGTELVRQYEALPPVACLPDELNQVWTNLIHNALQSMHYKGTLTVGICQVGEEAVVTVGDTGSGIPDAIRSRIFEPFFTTKPAGEGSGLGLDIVKKIVNKHRGRIEVRSEVGVGTQFSVHLPLHGVK